MTNPEEERSKEITRLLASSTLYLLFQRYKTKSGRSEAEAWAEFVKYIGKEEVEYAKALTEGCDFKQITDVALKVMQDGLAEQRLKNKELGVKSRDS